MIWMWLVFALGAIWVVLWFRSRRSAHQLRLADPRRLQALRLEDQATADSEAGRYASAQLARLRAVWLRTDPLPGADDPPRVLDPRDDRHLMLADTIRREYAQAMTDPSGAFADCTVKPSALLPFPKAAIAESLELFVRLGRGDSTSPHVPQGSITAEDLAVVERALQVLNTYVEVDPDKVPTDPSENLNFAKNYLARD